MMPPLRLAIQNAKFLHRHRQVQGEGTAGLALAIRAVAGVEQQRKPADLVADRPALAATAHGKNGSLQGHGASDSGYGPKDYPGNERAATPIPFGDALPLLDHQALHRAA